MLLTKNFSFSSGPFDDAILLAGLIIFIPHAYIVLTVVGRYLWAFTSSISAAGPGDKPELRFRDALFVLILPMIAMITNYAHATHGSGRSMFDVCYTILPGKYLVSFAILYFIPLLGYLFLGQASPGIHYTLLKRALLITLILINLLSVAQAGLFNLWILLPVLGLFSATPLISLFYFGRSLVFSFRFEQGFLNDVGSTQDPSQPRLPLPARQAAPFRLPVQVIETGLTIIVALFMLTCLQVIAGCLGQGYDSFIRLFSQLF